MSLTRVVAEHVANTRADAIPADALTAGKTFMLDTLGVAWAGATAPGIAAAHSVQLAEGGKADSSIWALGGRLPATAAAYLNSSLAAALDYDSVHQRGQVHADIVALPAALAVAQRQHATGAEFLAAYVIGVDLICRLGMSVTRNPGWFMTSVHGAFGAAAAAARLLRLDADRTANALGIVLSQTGGTQQALTEKSLTKRLQAGFSARAGVQAAMLAQAGITGPKAALEGPFGFYKLYVEGDPGKVTAELGSRFEIVNTTTKKYPSCTCNHTLIEGAIELMQERGLKAEDIESVEVFVSPFMNQLIGAPFDTSGDLQVTAQFSAQYSVASAIVRRKLGIAEIQESAVVDPKIGDLARRVKVTVDESNKEKFAPTEMVFRIKGGVEIRRRMEHVPGTPELPMSQSAHEQKFLECTSQGPSALPPEKRRELIERTRTVLTMPDMADFFAEIL